MATWEDYLNQTWTPSMANWTRPTGSIGNNTPTTAPTPTPQPTVDPQMAEKLKAHYGKLTGQASDALYGGILGYNPQPMTANGGQQFALPQGNLQNPFANMQGILGQSMRPQFAGGMGQMMQPKFNMGG